MEKPSALQVSKQVVESIEPIRSDIAYDIVMTYYQLMTNKIGVPAFKEDVLKSNGYLYCPDLNEFLNSSPSMKLGLTEQHFSRITAYSFSPQEKDLLEKCIISKIGKKRYLKLLEKNAEKKKSKVKANQKASVTQTSKSNPYQIPLSCVDSNQYEQKRKRQKKAVTNQRKKQSVYKTNEEETIDYLLSFEGSQEEQEERFEGVIAKNQAIDIAHWLLAHERKCTYYELISMLFYAYRFALQKWNKDASHLHYELFENKFKANNSWISYEDIDNAYAKYLNEFLPKYTNELPKFDEQTQSILEQSYQRTKNISKASFSGFIKSSPAWKRANIEKNPELKRELIYL